MPTTVNIPPELLERAGERARALGISRNRLIVEALEARLQVRDEWPATVVTVLTEPPDPELQNAAHELERAIRKGRRSRKTPPVL